MSEKIKCSECEREFDEDHIETVNGYPVCRFCHDTLFVRCDACGSESLNADRELNLVYRYTGLGNDTRRANYEIIEVCGNCFDDYHECEHCNDYFHQDRMERHNHEWYCNPCIENNYFTCDHCGEFLNNDDYANDGLCQSCSDDEESERNEENDDRNLGTEREMRPIWFNFNEDTKKSLNDPRSEL